MKGFLWIVATLGWFGGAAVSGFAALFVPMMFDAPGSEANVKLQALAACALLLPVFCVAGAVLPWIFRRWRHAAAFFLVPLADLLPVVVLASLV